MSASLSASYVDCAPGNVVKLAGTGLTGATLALSSQGLVVPASLPIVPTETADGVIIFVVPDGATSNNLVVTSADGTSQASVFLNVVSQYIQSSSYSADGEGTAALVAGLQPGEIDDVLRDASAVVDATIGHELRLKQVEEDHPFRESRRIYPYRNPRNRIPLVSLDSLKFITSNAIETQFNVTAPTPDVYVSLSSGYFDVQAYAVGNAILLGAIQTIGFSANRWDVIYTAGFAWQQYPRAIRKATAIIATEMLSYGNIQTIGLGSLSRVKQGQRQYDRRNEDYNVPAPVMTLLRPFISRSWA